MPVYEFVCPRCFEVSSRYDQLSLVRCPACGLRKKGDNHLRPGVRRVYSPFGFTFGWRVPYEAHVPGQRDKLVKDV
jgi:predicted nucleic acid-binding Zn ribbon protein